MQILLALRTAADTSALRQILLQQNMDCEIDSTADGLSTLIALIQKSYDLVILETELEMLPGLELLQYLRMVGRKRPVMLAGYQPTFEQARQGILNHVSEFLTLPLSDIGCYDLRLNTAEFPEHVDGYRTLQAAIPIIKSVAQRLEASSPHPSAWNEKLYQLYNTYIEFAFHNFPWLSNYCSTMEFSIGSIPKTPDLYYRMLGKLINTIDALYPQTKEPLLQGVLCYLLANIDQPLRQKDVATHFYISPSSLSLLFTENSSLVYNNYVFGLKLKRAAYFLQFSDMKIQDISTLLGYQDSGYFSRQFKKAYGLTPIEYRKRKE